MSALSPSLKAEPELDRWIRVEADGTVTVFTGKVEIGQGLATALVRIAAEELDLAPERVRLVTADTDRSPNEQITAGSMSIEHSGGALRQAAAAARALLVARAAAQLAVPAEKLVVRDGTVVAPDGRTATYAALSAELRFEHTLTGDAIPKHPSEHRLVGRPARRVDLPGKVAGEPTFVQDLRFDGMVFGRVVRPPAPGAELLQVDADAVRVRSGVLAVVRDGSFLGVVADREWAAVQAAEALRCGARWSPATPLPQPEELPSRLETEPQESLVVVDGVPTDDPIPPATDPEDAAITLQADYFKPYHLHASLGPSAAVAHLDAAKLTVWTHSQGVFPLRASMAAVLDMNPEDLRLIHVEGAGCYGHNGADDAALDAALLARAVPGRPLLLQWSREDEHRWEPYSPAMQIRARASLDDGGRICAWSADVYSQTHVGRPLPYPDASGLLAAWQIEKPHPRPRAREFRARHAGIHRNADPLYTLPQKRIVKHLASALPLRTSSTRGLGAYANVFAIESLMDELARAAGADPVVFRLRHLDDPRARTVIEAAAARAAWSEPRPPGSGRGIGFARYKNEKTYAAVVVDLAVDLATGAVALKRAVIAADAGQIIDPDGLANQLEGGFVQSASWTLLEQVRFGADGLHSVDWDSYPILRFPDVPDVVTELIDRPELAPLGAGEATQGPTAAAIANAVQDACGHRLRSIPFTRERVLAALS